MTDRNRTFEELYSEYRKLVTSTHIEAQILKPGQPYKVSYIKPEELMRRKEVAKELVNNYKDFFQDKSAEWFDLVSDTG